jgi:hypothetical protein
VDHQLRLIGPPLLHGRFGLLHVGGGDRLRGGVADRLLQLNVRTQHLGLRLLCGSRRPIQLLLADRAAFDRLLKSLQGRVRLGERGLGAGELGSARGDNLGPRVVDLLQIRMSRHKRRLGDRERRHDRRPCR